MDYSSATLLAVALRASIALWGHSGQGKPPMYGGFEAQRHWLEVTVNLPIGDWYRQTIDNDLQYWGLDYPPLTAYVSWGFGKLAQIIVPDLVALHSSRGHESIEGRLFMRFSVVIADILVLIPAILLGFTILASRPRIRGQKKRTIEKSDFYILLAILSCPAGILIDHGHFQYNGVCIGLTLLAACAILSDYDLLGSVLFCLSLNFKQMALYYSPVFFFALLKKCWDKNTVFDGVKHLSLIGGTVIATFASMWLPLCVYHSEDETCVSSVLHMLSRQFPFSRGIFEDKVSNIWYALSVIFDFRQMFTVQQIAQYSAATTLLLLSPVAVNLLLYKGTPLRLTLSLATCSLAFFLASFQVHEKSLLLPLVPSLFLMFYEPLLITWFQVFGTFTMFPLLVKDQLRTPYVTCCALFLCMMGLHQAAEVEREAAEVQSINGSEVMKRLKNVSKKEKNVNEMNEKTTATTGASAEETETVIYSTEKGLPMPSSWKQTLATISFTGMAVLHGIELTIEPPHRYPDLYPALFSLYGAANLVVLYGLLVFWLWSL